MSTRPAIFAAVLSLLAQSQAVNAKLTCRVIPGDVEWPTVDEWTALNASVGGRLIATVPIAAPCHKTDPFYDESACQALRDVWFFPETHLPSPTSPMAYEFTNNSCNPFLLDPDTPCTNGYLPSYTVNATGPGDFQAAIQFATKHNIRLTIRNSGHDYLGKSTGAHALNVWTHYMKSLELIQNFQPTGTRGTTGYTGPALKVGAGVAGIEAFEFANAHGLVVVGGHCPTVGLAGGYIQGGGHGPLVSKYGLAADQVLEVEVVTGTGELLTANAETNSDLFWAVRGGGGSTYGIVASVTIKAYPDEFVSLAYLSVADNGTNTDAIYTAVSTFFQASLLNLVDAGAWVAWTAVPTGFSIGPAFVPGVHAADLDSMLKPTVAEMDRLGLAYTYSSAEYPDFLAGYNYDSSVTSWNVSNFNLGGRLVPRALVHNNTEGLVEAVRYIASRGVITGVAFNVSKGVASPSDSGVNPLIRTALISAAVGTPLNYTDWSVTVAGQDQITNDFLPQLRALSPGAGAYMNEADFQDPNFQADFFGDHYDRLLQIKRKYDPSEVFYAKTAVGSDEWAQMIDGRLCRVC